MIYLGTTGNVVQQKFTDWLYGSYDEDKLSQFMFLYSIPGIRQYMDYQLDLRNDQAYLKRYNLDYSDIYDPRKLSSTRSGSVYYGTGYSMISKNVDRLYR